jgi:hypothetical protein
VRRPTYAGFQPQPCQSNFTPLRLLILESRPSGFVSGFSFYQVYDSRLLQVGKPAGFRRKTGGAQVASAQDLGIDVRRRYDPKHQEELRNQILMRSRIEATPSKACDMWACVL